MLLFEYLPLPLTKFHDNESPNSWFFVRRSVDVL